MTVTPETGWAMPWPGAEIARVAEDAGCQAFCAGEFADRNAYVTLAEMALSTTTAKVGHGRRLRVRPVTVRARLGRSPCRQDWPRAGCSSGSVPAPGA